MKKQFLLFIFLFILGIFLVCKPQPEIMQQAEIVPPRFTHYTNTNLRLRVSDDANSAIIFTLPQYTAVNIIKEGKADTINNIADKWLQVVSQTEITGWCFGAYVKPIEKDIAKEVAVSFAKRPMLGEKSGKRIPPLITGEVSLDDVRNGAGYYIQESPDSANDERKPEILFLFLKDNQVYINEIDVFEGKTIIRRTILLERDESGVYTHDKTYLELNHGKVQIEYLGHNVEHLYWKSYKYVFAGPAGSIPDSAKMLTGDYLKTFEGTYVFDSFELVKLENRDSGLDFELLKEATCQVTYDQNGRFLDIKRDRYHSNYREKNDSGGSVKKDNKMNLGRFAETRPGVPFIWLHGLGGGESELRAYFYKGGIVFTEYDIESLCCDPKELPLIRKYVIFFKKK